MKNSFPHGSYAHGSLYQNPSHLKIDANTFQNNGVLPETAEALPYLQAWRTDPPGLALASQSSIVYSFPIGMLVLRQPVLASAN